VVQEYSQVGGAGGARAEDRSLFPRVFGCDKMPDDVDVQWFGRSEGAEQGAGKVGEKFAVWSSETPLCFSANLPHGIFAGLATAPLHVG